MEGTTQMRQHLRIRKLCTAACGLAVSLFVLNGGSAQSQSCPDRISANANASVIIACINELKKQNDELKVEEYLEAEKMYNDQILYTAIFSKKINRVIDLSALSIIRPIKQIRA